MRIALASVKAFIFVFNLAIMLMLALAFVPLAMPGTLSVDMPSQGDWQVQFIGDHMSVYVPLRIYNGGYFDFNDFRMAVTMTDGEGSVLMSSQSPSTNVVCGSWTSVPVSLDLDLSSLPQETLREMVFTNDSFGLDLGLHTQYLFRLMTMDMTVGQNASLGPMISNVYIDVPSAHIQTEGGRSYLVVPFSFAASGFLVGQDLSVTSTLDNSTAELSQAQTMVVMEPQTTGELAFPLDATTMAHLATSSDDLTISVTLDFHGAQLTSERSQHWDPGVLP